MENIILQIVSQAATKFLDYFNNGLEHLYQMTDDLKKISDEMAKEMLTVFIIKADESICDAKKERKNDGIKIHERNVPRTLYTALGEFKYERTYFDMADGERKHLLDDILGVESYERIDSGISARLANAAAKNSFGRSAELITGGQISRQSVKNKVMCTGELVHIPERKEETPEVLHIFADEDHVHMQDGRSEILPLITVCEGKREVSKDRNELNDPMHIQGYGYESEKHWEYVYALCAKKYDMDRVKRIYIYGDGAAWIRNGFEVFTDAIHILDEFHFKARMKNLLAGEVCASYGLTVRGTISKNNMDAFDKTVDGMLEAVREKMPVGKEQTGRIKAIKEHRTYILTHWNAIQNIRISESIGSCTEALVSHVLSERFSRNPMGWSKEGLSKMSMIRVFVQNGGKVMPADTLAWKQSKNKKAVIVEVEKYEAIVKFQQEEIFKDVKNWRWFERDEMISDKRTGTRVALDALGRTRKIS